MRDKGMCAMSSCLTVGVPRGSPTEIDGRRFVKREREGIMREGEKDGGGIGGLQELGEAEECVRRPRRTCQGTN